MYYKTIQFNNNIKKHIIVLKNDDKLIIKKNQYYYLKLSSCKNKINDHIKYWNFYKYKLNPYEYIFNKYRTNFMFCIIAIILFIYCGYSFRFLHHACFHAVSY